ncbi:uncharacterized protein LOC135828470 [Sycon ciliatum]|uniref:uncharacterized protein LOC135828470 n=1 Tax=Sycon ciliatum TaxID=27933 RepID=UPI0031F64C73
MVASVASDFILYSMVIGFWQCQQCRLAFPTSIAAKTNLTQHVGPVCCITTQSQPSATTTSTTSATSSNPTATGTRTGMEEASRNASDRTYVYAPTVDSTRAGSTDNTQFAFVRARDGQDVFTWRLTSPPASIAIRSRLLRMRPYDPDRHGSKFRIYSTGDIMQTSPLLNFPQTDQEYYIETDRQRKFLCIDGLSRSNVDTDRCHGHHLVTLRRFEPCDVIPRNCVFRFGELATLALTVQSAY